METSLSSEEIALAHAKSRKSLLWISIVSMIMFFGAFVSGYIVMRHGKNWMHFELPRTFFTSTIVILISSVTMNWALSAAKKNNLKTLKTAAGITLLLGVAFTVLQFEAWKYLYSENIVFAGNQSFSSGSFLYLLTGLHLLHLAFGFIALLVVWVKSLREKYSAENYLGIELCAIFWHFLDILWVLLFTFLLFLR